MKDFISHKREDYKGYIYMVSLYKENGEYGVIVSGGKKESELTNMGRKLANKDEAIDCYSELASNNLSWLFAKTLAVVFHSTQVDRGGNPYLDHLIAVATSGETDEEVIVGFLHDIIEDTEMDIKTLHLLFPDEICDAVNCISRKPKEDEESYFKRIKTNPISVKVKLYDLLNNINFNRLNKRLPSKEDAERLIKYANEINDLMKYANLY